MQKVRKGTNDGTDRQQKSELETFYDGVEGLSYEDAVKFCSSEEVLKKTLEQFYRSIGPNADEIERFLNDEDWRNYTIKVHALKSSARLVGAMELSSDAKALEECGDNLDIETIRARTPKLLADYREYHKKLAPLYAAEEAARAAAPEISPETLNEAYEAIEELTSSFDIDAIDSVVAEVRKYRLPESEKGCFEIIETAVRNMDWAALEKALKDRAKLL